MPLIICQKQSFADVFQKSFLKISPISQKDACAEVSFPCEIGEIFKKTPSLQNTSGGCF